MDIKGTSPKRTSQKEHVCFFNRNERSKLIGGALTRMLTRMLQVNLHLLELSQMDPELDEPEQHHI